MHEIETWAPGSAACALCIINISSHEKGRPGRPGRGGPGPHGPPPGSATAVRNVKLRYIAILYTHSIGNQPQNTMVVFKMRDSVPSVSYSSVCNVLHQWNISLIPTYRVYHSMIIIIIK